MSHLSTVELSCLVAIAAGLHFTPSAITAPAVVDEKPVAVISSALPNQLHVVRCQKIYCGSSDLPQQAAGCVLLVFPYPGKSRIYWHHHCTGIRGSEVVIECK
jgi:hypothetical protein